MRRAASEMPSLSVRNARVIGGVDQPIPYESNSYSHRLPAGRPAKTK